MALSAALALLAALAFFFASFAAFFRDFTWNANRRVGPPPNIP